MSDDDKRLLIDLLVEQVALKIQAAELNTAALIDKLGVTQHQVYAVKKMHYVEIVSRAKELAVEKRRG
jgi:hypothetical protein